jgi:hypothetical protein
MSDTARIAENELEARALWTRLKCGRGQLSEHPGRVEAIDVDAPCWCGGPRVAATVYRVSETGGPSALRNAAPAS